MAKAPSLPPTAAKTAELLPTVGVKHNKTGKTFQVTKHYYLNHKDTLALV